MGRDLYADLGVRQQAGAAELKAAWCRAAMKHHPDRGGNAEAFLNAKLAYDFLSDPARRAKYDAARAAGSGQEARDSFHATWEAWEATLGELLPHLSALRTSVRGNDWRGFTGDVLGLANQLFGRPSARQAGPPPPRPGNLASRLRELQDARENGLLTEEEYRAKRAALIASL